MMAALINKDGAKMELVVLILCCGLHGDCIQELIDQVKMSSTNSSSHKRRELLWQAYTKLGNKAMSVQDDKIFGFFTFHLPISDDDVIDPEDGVADFIPATKRQKGMLMQVDIMGKKFKPPDADNSNSWMSCWFEEDAINAWNDLMYGEPVIFLSQDMDGVFIGTRLKRKKCKNAPSQPLKSSTDVESYKATLLPDNPLQSISFIGNNPTRINNYNFIMAGRVAKPILEDPTIPCVISASMDEIYDSFERNRNSYYVKEAEKLIDSMNTDIAKELDPLCNTSMKSAGIARRNGLIKQVYIHKSKDKFINAVKADASGTPIFIINECAEDSKFMQYGGVVFELHYRANLALFGG